MAEEVTEKVPCYSVTREGVAKEVVLSEVVSPDDMWSTGGIKIIGLVGIRKIAEKEGIVEKKFEVSIQPTKGNKQQHGINIWVGFKGDSDPDNWRRGSGEACEFNTGKIVEDKDKTRRYDPYGSVDSKYRLAMADKRAYCRAVLNMVSLYGIHAEVEAQEFATGKSSISDLDY